MDVDPEVGKSGNGGSSEMEDERGQTSEHVEIPSENITDPETCSDGAREILEDSNGNEQGDVVDGNDNGEGSSESKTKDESKVCSDVGEGSQVPELINLMPDSDDDSDGSENPNSEKVTFKKRKTSHSLRSSLRRRDQEKNSSSSSSDEEVPEVEPMAVSSPLQMPDLTSGEEGEASRTRNSQRREGGSRSRREIPNLTSSEGEDDRRKERVRARRIVRADDLVTVEGEDGGGSQRSASSSSSSDTDEDGTPSATFISEKAREVIFKPISASKHNVLTDLASRQMGLRMKPRFTSRRCGSADLVKRFKLAAKLSGHEGCVNCLNFNQVSCEGTRKTNETDGYFQAGTKIASGSDDLNIIVWEWERGR